MTRTTTAMAIATRGHERDAGHGQPEDRDHDDAAGEHDRAPGLGQRAADGLLDVHAARQVLAVPGHHEQRVVDAHAETDHGAEHRRVAGDVEQVREQGDGADADGEPEHRRADRQRRRDQRPEREQQDDERPAGCRPARRRLAGGCSKAKNRSPPISTRSGESADARSRKRLEVAQVGRAELVHATGTAAGAARPARPATRSVRWRPSTCGSAAASRAAASASAVRAPAESDEGRVGVATASRPPERSARPVRSR